MQMHGIREDHRGDTIGREGEVTMDLTPSEKEFQRRTPLSKVTGSAAYIQDVEIPGMLYGKILYSRYPHAQDKKARYHEGGEAPRGKGRPHGRRCPAL